ncbi:hypothetical protein DPMN_051450 [Dreissena polymorpha]|uniref:Uncharacterized protein n=1 Tax=Dreissena polymorpha TaxID=45954 RepID=A0A9D4HNB5_DREPO|nr:hypothetical protein DPMN_051450 [Dreissena polymorpha]
MRGSPAGGDQSQDPQQLPPPTATAHTVIPPGSAMSASSPSSTPSQHLSLPSQAQLGEETGQGDAHPDVQEDGEPEFPHQELARLDEMINRPLWVVPVLPKGELEVLLDASIKLCREGLLYLP